MSSELATSPTAEESRTDSSGVPPVERAIRLLRYIASGKSCANISTAARETGINRTTLIRLLHTLCAERMIEKRDDGRGYVLGFGLIGLAAEATSNRDVLRAARPPLAALAAETNLSAHLGVLDGDEVVYLIREVPRSHLVSNVHEGSRLPAHATTMGRMLLAHQPDERIDALYADHRMRGYSDVTATTRPALRRQLAEDRAAGLVWSDGNFEPDIGSCACPIHDHRGQVMAAINLSGPAAEFGPTSPRTALIEQAIRATALEISRTLGWSGRPAGGLRTARHCCGTMA